MTPDRIENKGSKVKKVRNAALNVFLVIATATGVAGAYKGAENLLDNSRRTASVAMIDAPVTGLLSLPDLTTTATIANRTATARVVLETGMTAEQIKNDLSGDPAVNESHFIAQCLQPSFRAPRVEQSLSQRLTSRLLSLFSGSVAEAAEPSKTPAEVVSCLKSNKLLVDFVLKNKGVNLNNLQENNVKGGDVTYAELPQTLADLKLMTLEQAKAIFDLPVDMTFKNGDVITFGPATMLDSETDVETRRANKEKMVFWRGESYRIVNINGVTLVFRQDCANLLLTGTPAEIKVSPPAPTATSTEVPTPPATSTAEKPATPTPPAPTATSTEVTIPTATATPTRPATPTAAPTNTAALPTETPGATATLVATRTPDAFTPTAIGTRPIDTATPRPATPTAAPTNTAALPTETPGATATLVATRTPDAFTPTAIRQAPNTPTPAH